MKQALCTLLVFLLAAPASAYRAPAVESNRTRGVELASTNFHPGELLEARELCRGILLLELQLAAGETNFGFTGREHDAWGGNYNRDRYYTPRYGNFLSADRAGMIDGPNLYAYARSNPVMNTDPSGLWISQTNSDPKQMEMLTQAIATRIGFFLYTEIQRSPSEFRLLSPSGPILAPYFANPGQAGLTGQRTAVEAAELESRVGSVSGSFTSCFQFYFISVDPVRSYRLGWSPEASYVHEMRHGADLIYGISKRTVGTQTMEARGYAAGIVAEMEMAGDAAVYSQYARRIAYPFGDLSPEEKLRIVPFSLLEEVKHSASGGVTRR